MIKDMVNDITDSEYKKLVTGKFFIGLEPIKEYVEFYIIAEYIQKEIENESMSIFQYANQYFIPPVSIDISDVKEADNLEMIKWNYYERKMDHYNTLNFEKKIDLLKRQNQEKKEKVLCKNIKTQGCVRRYNGNEIFKFQLYEFKILDGIKEGNYEYVNANKIYKRINSDKGYLYKIKFKDLKEFINILSSDIDKSTNEYKNILHYKLEKRLNFELIKSIAKAFHKCREKGEPDNLVLNDLIMLYNLPIIKVRQRYAEIYPTMDAVDRMSWRLEIDGLVRFLKYVISKCKNVLSHYNIQEIMKLELVEFKKIYMDLSYRNKYEIKKDFTADEFMILMKKLDDLNLKAINQTKEAFS